MDKKIIDFLLEAKEKSPYAANKFTNVISMAE